MFQCYSGGNMSQTRTTNKAGSELCVAPDEGDRKAPTLEAKAGSAPMCCPRRGRPQGTNARGEGRVRTYLQIWRRLRHVTNKKILYVDQNFDVNDDQNAKKGGAPEL